MYNQKSKGANGNRREVMLPMNVKNSDTSFSTMMMTNPQTTICKSTFNKDKIVHILYIDIRVRIQNPQ